MKMKTYLNPLFFLITFLLFLSIGVKEKTHATPTTGPVPAISEFQDFAVVVYEDQAVKIQMAVCHSPAPEWKKTLDDGIGDPNVWYAKAVKAVAPAILCGQAFQGFGEWAYNKGPWISQYINPKFLLYTPAVRSWAGVPDPSLPESIQGGCIQPVVVVATKATGYQVRVDSLQIRPRSFGSLRQGETSVITYGVMPMFGGSQFAVRCKAAGPPGIIGDQVITGPLPERADSFIAMGMPSNTKHPVSNPAFEVLLSGLEVYRNGTLDSVVPPTRTLLHEGRTQSATVDKGRKASVRIKNGKYELVVDEPSPKPSHFFKVFYCQLMWSSNLGMKMSAQGQPSFLFTWSPTTKTIEIPPPFGRQVVGQPNRFFSLRLTSDGQ